MQTSRRENLSNPENVEKLTIEQKKSKSGDDIENELLIESYENSGFQDDIRITRQKIFFRNDENYSRNQRFQIEYNMYVLQWIIERCTHDFRTSVWWNCF